MTPQCPRPADEAAARPAWTTPSLAMLPMAHTENDIEDDIEDGVFTFGPFLS